MDDEQNKLVLYRQAEVEILPPESFRERFRKELKRREVEQALRKGQVADPISASLLTSLAISAVVSAATAGVSYLVQRATAPKPSPITKGALSGSFQVMNSEQGLFIMEIYGADPGDGKGGVIVAPIIIYTSKIRRTVNVTRQPSGGGKAPSPPAQVVRDVVYDLDWAAMWGTGGPGG